MPEKPLDTLVSVLTPTKLQESYLLVLNSKELEVEEDQEVSKYKLISSLLLIIFLLLNLLSSFIFNFNEYITSSTFNKLCNLCLMYNI